jgi:hypothetical protein
MGTNGVNTVTKWSLMENLPDEGKPFGPSVLGYIHKQALQ